MFNIYVVSRELKIYNFDTKLYPLQFKCLLNKMLEVDACLKCKIEKKIFQFIYANQVQHSKMSIFKRRSPSLLILF